MPQLKLDNRRRSKVTKYRVIFLLIRAPGLKFCLRYNKFYGKGNEKVPEILGFTYGNPTLITRWDKIVNDRGGFETRFYIPIHISSIRSGDLTVKRIFFCRDRTSSCPFVFLINKNINKAILYSYIRIYEYISGILCKDRLKC
jgi:hypothetical protein